VNDLLQLDGEHRIQLAEEGRQRLILRSDPAVEAVVDRLPAHGLELRDLRVRPPAGGESLRASLSADACTERAPGWGSVAHVAPRTIWVPREPRRVEAGDSAGRLLLHPPPPSRRAPGDLGWELAPLPPGCFWSPPLVVIHGPEQSAHRELEGLAARSWPRLRKSACGWRRRSTQASPSCAASTCGAAMLTEIPDVMAREVQNQGVLTASETRHYESYQLPDELRLSPDGLTRMARTYVATAIARLGSSIRRSSGGYAVTVSSTASLGTTVRWRCSASSSSGLGERHWIAARNDRYGGINFTGCSTGSRFRTHVG
jgi:hypothetical protein